jgi:hypothetical protein
MGDTSYSQPTSSEPKDSRESTDSFGSQAPPEMQIDEMDIPYDDSDPF